MIIFEILAVVLLADFFAGFIHWAEDAYAREDMPIIGPLVAAPNVLHHKQPRAFLKKNWFQSSWDLLLGGALLVGAAAALGVLTWHVLAICRAGRDVEPDSQVEPPRPARALAYRDLAAKGAPVADAAPPRAAPSRRRTRTTA